MTNQEVKNHLGELILREREITHEILLFLNEADKRKLYLEEGYSSLFDWLTKFYGYSGAAAYRRISAARVLTDLPEFEEKVVSGELNLTTLSQAHAILKKEEKRLGQKISVKHKSQILAKIENKTSDETQKILLAEFPEVVQKRESLKVISATESELTLILDEKTLTLLKEAKDLLSHSLPKASWSEIIGALAQNFVQSKKSTSAAVSLRGKRKRVFEKARYRCEFQDPRTHKRCESTYQLEVDHVRPKALGGTDDSENLRCLCKQHNLLMAQRNLGARKMRGYWPPT